MSSVLKLALILLAATVLAIGARILYVNSQKASAAPEPEIRYRVAAADLPAGLLLREADLDWATAVRSKLPKGAIAEDNKNLDINGALLRKPLGAGHTLLAADLIQPDAPGFLAAALKPGMRALSVPINAVSGHAGLIRPGDYVDILLTQRLPGGQGSSAQVASETIVEAARIIAVGSTFQRDSDGSKPTRAQTITIEVDPRTAEAVTVASEIGSLSLALRSFAVGERDALSEPSQADGARVVAWEGRAPNSLEGPVWGQDISRIYQAKPRASNENTAETSVESAGPRPSGPDQPHIITIIRGEKSEQQEFSRHAH